MFYFTIRDVLWLALAATFAHWSQPGLHAEDPPAVPPPDKWIAVKEISEEYDYVRQQRSEAGGRYEVVSQSTGIVGDRHYDQLFGKCVLGGKDRVFTFDVTSLFQERALADSKEARRKAYADLDQRYPTVTAAKVPDLQRLLKDKNPHNRTWAMTRLAGLKISEADSVLLDAYTKAGLLDSWRFHPGLAARGDAILPLIEERLKAAKPAIPWNLLQVLETIPTERSARLLDAELQHALIARPDDRRACYMSIGEVSNPGSAKVLLEALQVEWPKPDEMLVWALARCGCKEALPRIKELLDSSDDDCQLSAIAAVGMLGDGESIPRLLEMAEKGKSHNARHNAIFALGALRAKEAVPLLLEYLRPVPNYEAHYHPIGLWPDWATTGNYIEASVKALGRIGDDRAIPEFRRILKHDRYYLNYEDVAAAAADRQWDELVPDIIDRLEADHTKNVELFGDDHERYSPALRKLTKQSLGEDPAAWRQWLRMQRENSIKRE